MDEELNRYEFTPSTSPEISIIRNYIDWLINLPWNKSTRDNNNIEEIRNNSHNAHKFMLKYLQEKGRHVYGTFENFSSR